VRPIEDEPRAIVSELRPQDSLLALDADGMAVFGSREDAWAVVAIHNAWPAISKRLKEALEAEAQVEAKVARARADAFREAARMTDRSSDMIRKTRGGVARACSELDMATRDLSERADQILAGQDRPLNERERDRRRDAVRKVFALLKREHQAKGEHGTATLLDLFPEFHEALTGWRP
jgi:hypothetical protein